MNGGVADRQRVQARVRYALSTTDGLRQRRAACTLVVCANVAGLLLTRGTARSRELSIRLSIGATRGRVIRQLLTESLLLSSLGGALGGIVAHWLRRLLPFGQLTGIVFGLLPAVRATRVDLAVAMNASSRSVVGSRIVLGKGLIVLQVAMSLVVLVGAGLFVRTVNSLERVDVGFDPRSLLMFTEIPAAHL